MKRSQQLKLIAVLCIASAVLLAALWLMVTIFIGANLVMNGTWLIASLLALLGVVFSLASIFAEAREDQ